MAHHPAQGFSSNTTLGGGHHGLKTAKGSTSSLTITGDDLANRDHVIIVKPPQSANPHYQWEGDLTDAEGTQANVVVTQVLEPPHHHVPRDDLTTVSVTVGGSAPTNVQVYTNPS